MMIRPRLVLSVLLVGLCVNSGAGEKEERQRKEGKEDAEISAMNSSELNAEDTWKWKELSPVWVIAHMSGSSAYARGFMEHCRITEAAKAQSANSFFVCLRHSALFPLKLEYASLYDLKVDAKRVDGAAGTFWHVYFFVVDPGKKLKEARHWRFSTEEQQP